MSDRPDWNEWILEKNTKFSEEELKKSDVVKLEKAKVYDMNGKVLDDSPSDLWPTPKRTFGVSDRGDGVGEIIRPEKYGVGYGIQPQPSGYGIQPQPSGYGIQPQQPKQSIEDFESTLSHPPARPAYPTRNDHPGMPPARSPRDDWQSDQPTHPYTRPAYPTRNDHPVTSPTREQFREHMDYLHEQKKRQDRARRGSGGGSTPPPVMSP